MAGSFISAALPAALNVVGGIFGANTAANATKKAAAQQAKGIQQGITESEGYYNTGQNFLAPYVQSGQQEAKLLQDVQGLNGPEAQAAALAKYRTSPSATLLGDVRDETFRRGMNTWAAQGGANSGRAMEDITRRMSDVTLNDYYRWQDLGSNMYGIGANAAGAAGNLAAGRGRDILGARTGQGTAQGSGTAMGGLLTGAGIAGAGNVLANFMGKTDFSKMFNTGTPTTPTNNVYPGSNPYNSYQLNTPGFYGNY